MLEPSLCSQPSAHGKVFGMGQGVVPGRCAAGRQTAAAQQPALACKRASGWAAAVLLLRCCKLRAHGHVGPMPRPAAIATLHAARAVNKHRSNPGANPAVEPWAAAVLGYVLKPSLGTLRCCLGGLAGKDHAAQVP